MHNGGFGTLEQVANQYLFHGGDFSFGNFVDTVATKNREVDSTILANFGEIADVVAFLEALTDERVRYEKAPFDHPQIIVPNGHPGNHETTQASPSDPSRAEDDVLNVPAVGANGRSTPLGSFYDSLPN
jgi:hypothetical protein